ncbi:MAG TPA: ATP-dependent zinc metalloprotease FtsH [Longilinea sp.]|nr:ATP-dependent zinc metalloprotease FtsH [Longilinea sp.]
MNTKNKTPQPDPNDEKKRRDAMRRMVNFGLSYLIVSLVGLWLFQQFVLAPLAIQAAEIPYSEFKTKLKAGEITQITLSDTNIVGEMKNTGTGTQNSQTVPFTTVMVPNGDPKLIEELDASGVQYQVQQPPSPLGQFLLSYGLPLALLAGIWYVGYQRMGGGAGGMGGVFGVGKSKATQVKPEETGVTYKDVGGCDEAITELQEVIQFLKAPEKFTKLGGRTPKGVLLIGPPGTGKTLLAKATAGEAGVSFLETSGSEFVEMFVGVGAARVRDLFEQARKSAPAIIFIDEIDAIGQSRGGAVNMGNNDEREQTLNQLLAEIDGFKTDAKTPVILMAATNRPEVLDPALLRAGRFDRQVTVGNPDLTGRLQILKIHSKKIKLAPEFDLERAARMTPGFSGADLANVMNEAALLAARRNAEAIMMSDFEAAIERVVAGLEKKTRVMNEQERTEVAYHESGHALVAGLVPHADPVAKISIVPRGRGALGFTMQMPTEDRYLLTMDELSDRIAVMLGGRAAEKVAVGAISTGASDDIQRATELARRMVTEFGMSEKLGTVRYAGQSLQYLGGMAGGNDQISPETKQIIDAEVQRIVGEQYERAQSLLTEHRAALESLTRQLLQSENLDGSAVKQALEAA